MRLSRRDFLRNTGLLAATAGLGGGWLTACGCTGGENAPAAPPGPAPALPAPTVAKTIKHGTIIGPGKYVENGETKMVLSIVDLDAKVSKARLAPLDFFAHGVSPHPIHPTKAVLFEKKGKGSCEVDLVKGEMTRKIETAADRQFYG